MTYSVRPHGGRKMYGKAHWVRWELHCRHCVFGIGPHRKPTYWRFSCLDSLLVNV